MQDESPRPMTWSDDDTDEYEPLPKETQDERKPFSQDSHEERPLAYMFRCEQCGKMFKRQYHLKRHAASVHSAKKDYVCLACEKRFSRRDKLTDHMERKHVKE